ncbi:hydrogenase maturation protease [Candidatus Bipolaricaulota sp. J31]
MGRSRNASAARAIVALGNLYRTDDGVGIALLRALESVIRDPLSVNSEIGTTPCGSRITVHGSRCDLLESVRDGLRLAEAILGYEGVLIVDAAPWLPAGEIRRFRLEELPDRAGYPHGLGLRGALEALRRIGEGVPEVEVLAIGVPGDLPFGEGLSPEVERALPRALAEVKRWLNGI